MSDLGEALAGIVGKVYCSGHREELHFYASDPGLELLHEPEWVVAPRSVEEVQAIVRLANERHVPIVPMGAGMSLAGLTIPQKGGIVVDLKRMNQILRVDAKARYVVVEGGACQGMLRAHLDAHYPQLCHNIPEAPPTTTIAANLVIHGQGRLTQQYGFTSDALTGLEVVLPTGEICKVGSCALSDQWFSKGPTLPDLSGLFVGWLGATGIITKAGLRLYPKKRLRDVEIFITDRADLVPDVLYRITHTEMAEDILITLRSNPEISREFHHVIIYVTGDTEEELEFKRKMVWDCLKSFRDAQDGGFLWVLPTMKPMLLETPQKEITRFADEEKGGGFSYTGPIVPTEKYPRFAEKVEELGQKYQLGYGGMARVIGRSHAMMYGFGFPFNRADPELMDRVRRALHEAFVFALDQGGVPWKPTAQEQQMTMERMDPVTLRVMGMIKRGLDPNGIMNPGNWEMG